MRNVVPLVGIGCVTVILLGAIVGGIVMIGYGVGDVFNKDEPKQAPPPPAVLPPVQQVPNETQSLSEARSTFKTTPIDSNYQRIGEKLPLIPTARTVHYPSQNGNLAALLSIPVKNGPKQPLVVWIHDGFGGITSMDWDMANPFRDAGCAVMVPTFRAEVNNPGQFEMCYGEVDDLFAAIEYGASQPGIDANRVYVVGRRNGGTLALLAAVSGREKPAVRAYFALGGTPSLAEQLNGPNAKIANVTPPFDPNGKDEARLRSALPFAASIRQPTFLFGAASVDQVGWNQSMRMAEVANRRKATPFRALLVPGATRDNFVAPLVRLISEKIETDRSGTTSSIRFDDVDFNQLIKK
jgi:dienelactone hydrolase